MTNGRRDGILPQYDPFSSPESDPMNSDQSGHDAALELLIDVVYELLDAHDDSARLAADTGVEDDPDWATHLDYLRGLQRAAREDLALALVAVA
jgi:hypothetical protein